MQTLQLILVLPVKPFVYHENTFVAIIRCLASAVAAWQEIPHWHILGSIVKKSQDQFRNISVLIIPCAYLTGLFSDLGANAELHSWEGKEGNTASGRSASALRPRSRGAWLFAKVGEHFADKDGKC